MSHLGVSSKLNTTREFLAWLFHLGRRRGEAFLDSHFDQIGRESSVAIEERFL